MIAFSLQTAAAESNIALGKTATQSSIYDGSRFPVTAAIDGITTGFNNDFVHTLAGVGQWWQVDLGAVHRLSSSNWFNRADYGGDRMNNYIIQRSLDYINWTNVSHQTIQMGSPTVIAINADARYIRLWQNKNDYINFSEAQIFGAPPADYYRLQNKHSGLFLDALGQGMSAGDNVGQWQDHPGAQQIWVMEESNGEIRLENRNSGLFLDVLGQATHAGANVGQWSNHPGAQQRWVLEQTTDGFVKLRNRHSGLYLDVLGQSTDDGANVGQWSNHPGDQQKWKLIPESLTAGGGRLLPSFPRCDGWTDAVGDLAGSLARDINDMAQDYIANQVDLVGGLAGNLVSGNFEGMADNVIDFSNKQMLAQFNRVMLPVSLGLDVLPAGAVTRFLTDVEALSNTLAPMVIQMANPLNTVKGDAGEIGGDFATLFESLADPADFPKAYFEFHQKWNPAYSMSYLFTEDDPMRGAQKAAARIQRQVEIVTTYVTPFAGPKFAAKYPKLYKFAQAIDKSGAGKGSNQVVKNLVKRSIKEGEARNVAESLLRNPGLSKSSTLAVNTLIARTMALVDQGIGAGVHPFYTRAEIRPVPTQFIVNDRGSGARNDMALWRPRVEGTDCISLGDFANQGEAVPALKAVCGVNAEEDDWWTRPTDYQLVWGDNCSGGYNDLGIWKPVCPVGFTNVGFVATGWSGQTPRRDRIACLLDDPSLFSWLDGNQAGMQWVTNDKGSGAKFDVTIYRRDFAGLPLMYAAPGYPDNHENFLASLDVPVVNERRATFYVDATDLALANNASVSQWGRETTIGTPIYRLNQTPNAGPAVEFDGDDRLVENIMLPHSSEGDFIVAAVIKPRATGAYQNIVDDDASSRPMLWIDGLFGYEFNFAGGSGSRQAGRGVDGWDIVIADSKNNKVYINSATANATGGGAVVYSSTQPMDFLQRDGRQTFQGLVAEIRVYNDRRTFGGDIAALYSELQEKWLTSGL